MIALANLRPKQIECMRLVHDGKKTKEIARLVGLSPETVYTYIKAVMRLYGVSDRRLAAQLMITDLFAQSAEITIETSRSETDPNISEALGYQSGRLESQPSSLALGPLDSAQTFAEVREAGSPYRTTPQGSKRWVPASLNSLMRGELGHNGLSPIERGVLMFLGAMVFAIVFALLTIALLLFGTVNRWVLGS